MTPILAWGLAQGANALNIIAGVIVAHLASPGDFARFATLSAALAIIAAAINPLINEIAQRVASHRSVEFGALKSRSCIALSAAIVINICACASIVDSGIDAVIIYALMPVAFVAQSWVIATLYGLHRMVAAGSILCAAGLGRIATLCGFIAVGATFTGATTSYLVYFLVTVIGAPWLLSGYLTKNEEADWSTNWRLICGFFLLALPFSLDQPIVQALFTDISADYAALMTYARSLMLLATPALTIIYSASIQTDATEIPAETKLPRFTKPFSMAVIFAFGLAAILWVIHPFLFPLLLGAKYLHTTSHLGLALCAIALHVISYFLIQRLLLACSWRLCGVLAIPPVTQAIFLTLQSSPSVHDLTVIALSVLFLQTLLALWATQRSFAKKR
jgi:hypothetical protein